MRISFSPPDVGELEAEQVVEALQSGWIKTGPKTKELEKEVAEILWSKPCCMSWLTDCMCRNDITSIGHRCWGRSDSSIIGTIKRKP